MRTSTTDPEELILLRACAADPFAWGAAESAAAIEWFEVLRDRYPLMCLRSAAYDFLSEREDGATVRERFIECLEMDDPLIASPTHSSLDVHLRDRRLALAARGPEWSALNPDPAEPPSPLSAGRPLDHLRPHGVAPQEPGSEPMPEEPGGLDLAARKELMTAIHREVGRLMELMQGAGDVQPSSKTERLLVTWGLQHGAERLDWCRRLALPPLSRSEIHGSLASRPAAGALTRSRLALCLIGRRLRVDPATLARSMGKSTDAEVLTELGYGTVA